MKKFLILLGVVTTLFLATYVFRNQIGNGLIAAGERSDTQILKIPLIKTGLWFTTSFQEGVEKSLAKVGEKVNDPVQREKALANTNNFLTTLKNLGLMVWNDPLILIGPIAVFLLFMLIFDKDKLRRLLKSMLNTNNLMFAGLAAAAYFLAIDPIKNAESVAPVVTTAAVIAGLLILFGGLALQLFGDLFQNAFNVLVPTLGVVLLLMAGLGAMEGWFQIGMTNFVNGLTEGTGFWPTLGKIVAGTYNFGYSLTLHHPLTTNGMIAVSLTIVCAMYFITQKIKAKNGGRLA